MSGGWAFTFDASGCSGCKACQAACKDRSGLEVGRLWRRVYEISGGEWQADGPAWRSNAFAYNLSIGCNHCESPVCVEVCPTGALQRDGDGIVLVDAARCVGCRYCSWACPYGAPQYHVARGVMTKCDFCRDKLAQGLPPACVAACPLRVLDVVERDKTPAPSHIGIFPLPDARLTQPALVVVPPAAARDGRAARARLANAEEVGAVHADERPLVWFTVLVQTAVGLQVGLALASILSLIEQWSMNNLLLPIPQPWVLFSLAAALLSGAGLLASLRHLGRPSRAWRALWNWRTSPLTREVWLAGAFFGISAVSLVAALTNSWTIHPAWIAAWSGLVAGVGLATVAGMAQVYDLSQVCELSQVCDLPQVADLPFIPTWKRCKPRVLFLQTSLALGCLGSAALHGLHTSAWSGSTGWVTTAGRGLAFVGITGLVWIVVWEGMRRNGSRAESEPRGASGLHFAPQAVAAIAQNQQVARRLHLTALAVALPALFFAGQAWFLMFPAWFLAFAAELSRRNAFYWALRE